MYCRKCSVTNKGMNSGYVVCDEYAIDKNSADLLAKNFGFSSYQEAFEDEQAYYTEWESDYEIQEQEYYYDENGDKVEYLKKTCHICLGETLKENQCKRCEEYYCEDCSASFSIHSQIDYNCCSNCSENQ